MSCPPPPEILDLIVDDLHDEPATLKSCCVVSKSWVPRARKYLFARVEFRPLESHIERWKKTFPDPSNSPAHHTRSLSICGIPVVTAADAGVDGWIRTFHNVEHLRLDRLGEEEHQTSLAPFYGLSPAVRSLSLISTSIEVFDLICSFPLLEDLALIGPTRAGADGWNTPSISPKFTGSLHLRSTWEISSITHRLCALPGGLHFTKITLGLSVEDGDPIMDLISSCSDTLESLSITCFFLVGASPPVSMIGRTLSPPADIGTSRTPYLDLSKATKLKDLELRWKRLSVGWITMALGTVKSEYLRKITIHPTTAATIEDSIYQEWQELDQLLVQFWTTHSVRPRLAYRVGKGGQDLRDCAPRLLPELSRRGLVDLVEVPYQYYVEL